MLNTVESTEYLIMNNFRSWLESFKDVFGFDDVQAKKPKKVLDDMPIRMFSPSTFSDNLHRYRLAGVVGRETINGCRWGEQVGAIRVRLNPNLLVYIEKYVAGLDGEPAWINKKTLRIRTEEQAGREESVAYEVFSHVKRLSQIPLDAALDKYNLHDLARIVAQHVKGQVNPFFYFEKLQKVDDNNYQIIMNATGYGVGQIVAPSKSSGINSGVIDLKFRKEKGLIQGTFYTVSTEGESGAWEIDVPYFLALFAPTQDQEEITQNIINGFKFF